MARVFYLLAATATVLITVAHVFGGGPVVIDPLLANQDLPEVVIWLLYFCWHDGTVTLLVCAGAFAFAGLRQGNRNVGAFAAMMITGISALGLGTAILGSGALWATPAPFAFGIIGLLAWIAVARDRIV